MLKYILYLYLLFTFTYIYYVSVIKIVEVRDKIHLLMKLLIIPHLILGVGLDVLVNLIIGSLLGLERPREWLFTARLKRWKASGNAWQRRVAHWLCEGGLNPIDPNHC